jgi:hypothetical protein
MQIRSPIRYMGFVASHLIRLNNLKGVEERRILAIANEIAAGICIGVAQKCQFSHGETSPDV